MRISLMRMGMKMKMSSTVRIDDKQICLSSETCIFISFVHRVQILHNVWVRRLVHLVHFKQRTMHLVQCTMYNALCTMHYALSTRHLVHFVQHTMHCALHALCTAHLCSCVQIGTSANGAGQVRGMWLWTQLLEYELSWTLLEYESLWTLLEQTLTEWADIPHLLVST